MEPETISHQQIEAVEPPSKPEVQEPTENANIQLDEELDKFKQIVDSFIGQPETEEATTVEPIETIEVVEQVVVNKTAPEAIESVDEQKPAEETKDENRLDESISFESALAALAAATHVTPTHENIELDDEQKLGSIGQISEIKSDDKIASTKSTEPLFAEQTDDDRIVEISNERVAIPTELVQEPIEKTEEKPERLEDHLEKEVVRTERKDFLLLLIIILK